MSPAKNKLLLAAENKYGTPIYDYSSQTPKELEVLQYTCCYLKTDNVFELIQELTFWRKLKWSILNSN